MTRVWRKQLLVTAGILAGVLLSAGAVLAYNPAHENIYLRDPDGALITGSTSNNAFSMKTTCGACHNGSTGVFNDYAVTKALLSYDQIERHSFHAQLAANEQRGWNNWNPDNPDSIVNGDGPKGKNWVQGPGHVGAW